MSAITSEILSATQYSRLLACPTQAEAHSVASGTNYLVVDTRAAAICAASPLHRPRSVVIGFGEDDPLTDVSVTDEAQLVALARAIDAQPLAAASLVQVLRHNAASDAEQGLLLESLAYSTLQHSRGFTTWLASRQTPVHHSNDDPVLLLERTPGEPGSILTLTLNRPTAHNAYDADLKDALCEALALAHSDSDIQHVHLKGAGASFSAGGDLSEFGLARDAAEAHVSRTTRSAAYLLATLRCPSSAFVHGVCIGAGIELPAFTQHITAHPETTFQLPEVAFGLVPGAGGTVSITRRIGRHRTAWLALTGTRLDAHTALQWGLIDALEPASSINQTRTDRR